MSNEFDARGNLGTDPELRVLVVDEVDKPRVHFRVYFDNPVPDGAGGFTDKGGFWQTVYLWGKQAEDANRLLLKGMRVRVEGKVVLETWIPPDSKEVQSRYVIQAWHVDLDLSRIDAVTLKPKAERESFTPPADDVPIIETQEAPTRSRASKTKPAEATA